jgi:putative transcriptional regulator
MTKAGKRLLEAANEMAAIAKGEAAPARVYVPAEIDVRTIRKTMDMTQDDFAATFVFSLQQIRDWEQGRSRPLGGVRAYLLVIEKSPEVVRELLRAAGLQREAA